MKMVIVKPLITEASMRDAGVGKFTFLVFPTANKTDVRQAVEKMYNVNVAGVATATIKRRKTVFTKYGRKKVEEHIKKARVKLKNGQTIPAFEAQEEGKKKKGKEEGR